MSAYEIIVLCGMCVVTFGIRYILIGFSSRIRISDSLKQALEYVPPAVLTAIVVPGILIRESGAFDVSLGNPYLPAAIAAIAAQILGKRLLLTIVLGIGVFFVWKLYFL